MLFRSLIKTTSTGYQITGKGQSFIDKVVEDETAFFQEWAHLKEIGKEITENMVESVAKGWEAA